MFKILRFDNRFKILKYIYSKTYLFFVLVMHFLAFLIAPQKQIYLFVFLLCLKNICVF